MKDTSEAKRRREYTRRWRAAHPLDEAGRKARREYTRAWLKAHPDRVEMYRRTRAAKRRKP
jgi:hypothetical protein